MIPGYDILDRIHNGHNSQIYRAIDRTNHRPVIIKLPADRISVLDRILQFWHQYGIARELHHPQIIETYSLEPYQNSYALVMEDAGSLSLSEWLDFTSPSIVSKLQIAIDLTLALHELNQQRIIHRNINPTNILIHPITHQVKLIDFGIATLLPTETIEILSPQILQGTLAYIAPEQTGRMNRRIDYRCDFYSLGVTLFELFTGELPFHAEDGMGWIHRHLTQIATSAHLVNPNVPVVVAQIIARLMAKNAEDRYQTAAGVKYDLSECLRQLQEIGAVTRLKIGTQDLRDKFLIPQRLYGREIEVKILLDAFARVVHGGCELMLVAGSSGIGKTAVVNQLYQPITRQQGYLIKGKFDQFNRDLPLAAFVRAFRDLISQLLADSSSELADWNSQILAVVGDSGQVLIDVIPELTALIGEQPLAPKLSGIAAKNRFNWLFQKFIEIFATPKHPLVIFLDDLQWADPASLHLIKLLVAGVERGNHLLLLGAYRENEVPPAHPLMLMLGELPPKHVQTITLEPLTYNDINQLIADTLHCPIAYARPLTELVILKTHGNPFFVNQFLQALYAEEVIRFIPPATIDEEHWGWECDIAQVQALALTDDIATLMAAKLQKLPLATQSLLKWAACIGNSFDLDLLSIVAEQTHHQITMALWAGLEAGLICHTNQTYKFFQTEADRNVGGVPGLEYRSSSATSYRFLHDRVQQAAYNLIPPDQKQQTHLQMGRLLLANTADEHKIAQLFEIVNHLNLGIELIQTKAEREVVARINLQAAQKAKATNADGAAFAYAQIGVQVLGVNAWKDQYQLTLSLYQTLSEAALTSGEVELVPSLVQVVFDRAKTILDRIASYETLIEFYTLKKQYPQAIDLCLEILRQLGLKLNPEPSKSILSRELAKTKILLWGKSNEDLLNLPAITLPNEIAKLRILHLLQDSAFFCSQELLMLSALVGVQLTIRYGNSPWAAVFYGGYCIMLSNLGEPPQTDGIAQLMIVLADRAGNLAIMAQVRIAVGWFCQPWQKPFRTAIPLMDESFQLAVESGSQLYLAGLSAFARLYSGFPLEEVDGRIQAIEGAILQSQNENSKQFLDLLRQTVLNLRQPSNQPAQILGVNEGGLVSQWQSKHEATILSILYSHKTFLAYLFEDIPAALNYANAQLPYEYAAKGGCPVTQLWLFDSLTRLAAYPQADDRLKSKLLDRVNSNQRQLSKRAQLMPGNFQHKYDLVAAEQCRLFSNFAEAIELYDRAIAGARTNEYIPEEALANELAAKFYLGWNKPKIAAVYLQEAVDVYQKWGAAAKITDLNYRYPQLLNRSPKPDIAAINEISISRSNFQLDNFDLAAAIESTKALSNIIELPNLIDRLCEILRTNSGAEICIPILRDRQNRDFWQVCKTQLVESDRLERLTLIFTPLNQCDYLPLRMIDRVQQQGETLTLDREAQNISRLTDEYLIQHQPQSAMCLPLINAGELQGIIYLENRHTADVFTVDRQILLELIAAQVAISLHNAQLYESVSQRSAAIEAALDGMGILNENGHFIYLNLQYAQMYGYSVEELIGQPWQYLHNPENVTYIEQNICPLLEADGQWRGEVISTRKDGSTFDKELTLFNLANGQRVSICRDITKQKQLAADLAVSQQKYYTLIQSVSGVVWEYDLATERFIFISDRVVSLFGYPIENWLSQPNFWQDRIYPEDLAPTVRTYDDAVEYRYDCEFEYRMVTADNRVIWIYDISTIIRDAEGVPIGTTGLFIDISDLKQVETDLQQTNERLALTNEELQRATRLKDEFLATMSHELRTPLNAVLGMSQALQEQAFGAMNPSQLKSLSTIERNGRHLLSLINDILDISKISAGKLELNLSDVSLPELCESTLVSIEQQATKKQIQLTTNIPQHLVQISIDERRIRQVLINLLNNAIKFTPEGGSVTLTVRTEIDPTSDKYALYFDIIDTGIGIDNTDLSKLFTPFSQLDGNLNRKYEGTGLGLSIVKHIIEVHGGTIAVESQIGIGSCFTVMIPQTLKSQPSTSSTDELAPLILLAEDSEVNISSFSSYLSAKGYRTIFAQTGSAAISLAQTDRPDLILIDLHLPDLDGFAAITQAPGLAQIPIIALTASSTPDTNAKCLAIGATKSLKKPVKLKELHQTIQACLEITDSVN